MTLPVQVGTEASAELEAAAVWYELQRHGLGEELLNAIDDALRFISRFPRVGTVVPDLPVKMVVRRVPVRRFPFYVVYAELAEQIRVLAFAHERQSPGYWRSRVEN